MITARELFEKWKPPYSPGGSQCLSSEVSGPSRRRFITSIEKTALAGLPWIRWPAILGLPKKLRKAARILFRIASNVVVVLSSPLGMTRERRTKARATQSWQGDAWNSQQATPRGCAPIL